MDFPIEIYLIQMAHGLVYGMLIFLVASGLTLVLGMMDVLNITHAVFYMFGAYFSYSITRHLGNFWLGLARLRAGMSLAGRMDELALYDLSSLGTVSAVEDALGDPCLQDLDGAAGDHPAAGAAHAVIDQGRLAEAGAAHYLHRLVGGEEPGLVAGDLGERGLLARGQTPVGVDGGPVEEEPRRLELQRRVGELPLQALKLGN